MKLNKNFIAHTIDGMTVVVPVAGADFHGLVQGNKTLAAIAECLKSETTEEQITDTLCARFDGDGCCRGNRAAQRNWRDR